MTWTWERFLNDEMTRLLSLGHFSRSELLRSFVRPRQDRSLLPTVYEARMYVADRTGAEPAAPGGADAG